MIVTTCPHRNHLGVVIGMSGISVLESESRGDKLWVPTGTRAQEDFVSASRALYPWGRVAIS